MRILVTIPCLLIGGTEIQTLNLVRALVNCGHEVTTACFFEHADHMIQRYEEAGSAVILFSKEGARAGGLSCVWFLLRHLWRIKQSIRPDVVHAQYMAPGALPIVLLWLMGQKNIFATAHTTAEIYDKHGLRKIHLLQKYVIRVFTCITELAERSFFNSSSLFVDELFLLDGKLPRHSHFTIHNSLPYDMFFPDKRKGINDSRTITLGVVSRLVGIKGMDLVIPVFARIHNQFPETRMIIVGDGELGPLMWKQATALKVNEIIMWAGHKSQGELWKWYGQMDIVLMPSRSEGFGLTAIEAMANGCVVVASNVGGLPEVVKDGIVGLLHEKDSVEDIVTKVCMLLSNPNLLNRFRAIGYEYVSRFSFTEYSKAICSLYSII